VTGRWACFLWFGRGRRVLVAGFDILYAFMDIDHGLAKQDTAFFNLNGLLSLGMFVATLGDVLSRNSRAGPLAPGTPAGCRSPRRPALRRPLFQTHWISTRSPIERNSGPPVTTAASMMMAVAAAKASPGRRGVRLEDRGLPEDLGVLVMISMGRLSSWATILRARSSPARRIVR